jgi:hypothetical protein
MPYNRPIPASVPASAWLVFQTGARGAELGLEADRGGELQDGFVISARMVVRGTEGRPDGRRERVELLGAGDLAQGLIEPAHRAQAPAVNRVRRGAVGIQLQGALAFALGPARVSSSSSALEYYGSNPSPAVR